MRAEEIFAQHERLNVSLDRLALLVAGPLDQTLPENRGRAVFEAELRVLRVDLRGHFTFEEEGGYLVHVVKRDPNLSPQVEALKSEHPRLLNEVDALERVLQEKPLSAMREAVETFLRRLNGHERREAQLLQGLVGNGPAAQD